MSRSGAYVVSFSRFYAVPPEYKAHVALRTRRICVQRFSIAFHGCVFLDKHWNAMYVLTIVSRHNVSMGITGFERHVESIQSLVDRVCSAHGPQISPSVLDRPLKCHVRIILESDSIFA